jgi:hypothetical protein
MTPPAKPMPTPWKHRDDIMEAMTTPWKHHHDTAHTPWKSGPLGPRLPS